MTDGYIVTLDALGRSYEIPGRGQTDWRGGQSRYLRDLATVVNDASSGSLVTPVFNVKTYGATGNGTSDDTSAIQAAMTAGAAQSGGYSLYFPTGSYKVTAPLSFSGSNIRVEGDGPTASTILQFGAFSTSPLLTFTSASYWGVSNIALSGANATGTNDLLLVHNSSYGSISNSRFVSARRYGVNFTGTSAFAVLEGNTFSSNATADVNGGGLGTYVAGTTRGILNGGPLVQGQDFDANNPLFLGSNRVWVDTNGDLRFSDSVPADALDGNAITVESLEVKSVRDFGAVGDNSTDDTAAIQAAFDWFGDQDGPRAGTLYFPPGRYRITDTVTYTCSNPGYSFNIQGENGGMFGNTGTDIVYAGPAGQTAVRLIGWNGSLMSDIGIQGGELAQYLLHIDNELSPTTFVGTSTSRVLRCRFYDFRNNSGGACIAVGSDVTSGPLVGTQVSEMKFEDCLFYGRNAGNSASYVGYGMKILQGANCKNFYWLRCNFNKQGLHIGQSFGATSGTWSVSDCTFGSCSVGCISGGEKLIVSSCGYETEPDATLTGYFIDGGAPSQNPSLECIITGCYAVANFPAADDLAVRWPGPLFLQANTFRNLRIGGAYAKIVVGTASEYNTSASEAGSCWSFGNWYYDAVTTAPIFDNSGNRILDGFLSSTVFRATVSIGDFGGQSGSTVRMLRWTTAWPWEYTRAKPRTPASGTGITTVLSGAQYSGLHKVTLTFAAFQAAATSKEITLATVNAKVRLLRVYTDTTSAFTGTAGTVNLQVGSTAGADDLILAHDVKSAPVVKGLANADLGTSIERANAVQGGYLPAGGWASTWDVYVKMISGAGNLSGLTTGSVTIFLEFEVLQ